MWGIEYLSPEVLTLVIFTCAGPPEATQEDGGDAGADEEYIIC